MHTHNFVTYEEFGRRFFDIAVTEERVAAALAEIAGDEFEMGPMAQGPGGLAKVTARVKVNQPHVRRNLGDTLTFAIRIPLEIELIVDLRIDRQRFKVDGDIALRATARAAEPLTAIQMKTPTPTPMNKTNRTKTRTRLDPD